jgi:hypothetical protein
MREKFPTPDATYQSQRLRGVVECILGASCTIDSMSKILPPSESGTAFEGITQAIVGGIIVFHGIYMAKRPDLWNRSIPEH